MSIAGNRDLLIPGELRTRSRLRDDDAQLMELRELVSIPISSRQRLSRLALILLFIRSLTRLYTSKDALIAGPM